MTDHPIKLVAFDMEGCLTDDPTVWEIMHRKLNTWESHGDPYWRRYRAGEFGYDEAMFAGRQCNEVFRRLLAAEVDEAEAWLRRGLPLVGRVPRWMQLEVALFIHGGLAILEAVRRQDYDVWSRRPVVSRLDKLRLAARCWWQLRRGKFRGADG